MPAKCRALPGPQPRAATVTALTNVQSYVLLRSTFQSFMVCGRLNTASRSQQPPSGVIACLQAQISEGVRVSLLNSCSLLAPLTTTEKIAIARHMVSVARAWPWPLSRFRWSREGAC